MYTRDRNEGDCSRKRQNEWQHVISKWGGGDDVDHIKMCYAHELWSLKMLGLSNTSAWVLLFQGSHLVQLYYGVVLFHDCALGSYLWNVSFTLCKLYGVLS